MVRMESPKPMPILWSVFMPEDYDDDFLLLLGEERNEIRRRLREKKEKREA